MRKLLSANLMRLRKSATFWLCAISTLLLSLVMICMSADGARTAADRGIVKSLDDYYFQLAPYIGAITAVFISLFLGTEYSDGTIRNKLVAGHTRTNIYLANFLTCLTGGVIITVLWLIGGVPGIFMIGNFDMGLSEIIAYIFVSIGTTMAFTAFFVWISTLSRNKAITVVLVLVLWVAMVLTANGINDRLHELEFNSGMAYINGEFVMINQTPNPLYLTGSVRVLAEWLFRLLPTGPAIAMMNAEMTTPILNIIASLIVTVAITTVGILLFRKKDLK